MEAHKKSVKHSALLLCGGILFGCTVLLPLLVLTGLRDSDVYAGASLCLIASVFCSVVVWAMERRVPWLLICPQVCVLLGVCVLGVAWSNWEGPVGEGVGTTGRGPVEQHTEDIFDGVDSVSELKERHLEKVQGKFEEPVRSPSDGKPE